LLAGGRDGEMINDTDFGPDHPRPARAGAGIGRRPIRATSPFSVRRPPFPSVPGHPYEQGFDLRLVPDKLLDPLRLPKPRMVFVNSMSDLFHKDVPDDYVKSVVEVMRGARHGLGGGTTGPGCAVADFARNPRNQFGILADSGTGSAQHALRPG